MLSQETRNIVKATVPVLEQHGVDITKTFYRNMLDDHKELLNIFNRVNQVKGAQPTALATTVLAAAKHIDNLEAVLPHVEQIGHKHRALQIQPEHYPIVGKHLLNAIRQVLGDAASPEILNAWGEAYGVIADVFITVEKKLYENASWPGWKPFRVTNREHVADEIVEFTVKPTEESGVSLTKLPIIAGQYITVNTHPTRQNNQYDALRHYSICSASAADGLKFAVKYEHAAGHEGLVSQYLHQDVSIGDEILLSAPAGDFSMDQELIYQNEVPLVLLSSGVGATPLLAMLENQVHANPKRPVIWIQSSYDTSKQAFSERVNELLNLCSSIKKYTIYTKDMPRIDANYLQDALPAHADVYICGSVEFMSGMLEILKKLEHKEDTIHYEPFGPKMATLKV